ncbi:MAG: adenylate/guanylate cyclase domain-containing protein [Candidatus Edwardsbacteria bacterium]
MSQKSEERRLITILFADLSGFTALAQHLDPEDVREVANICFEHLNQPIIQQGGTIHKYEGDLVIALFGLPATHEDDPERAIKSSLEMMEALPEINEKLTSELKTKTNLGLHIGINSGTVVVGEVGSPEKKEYTVMGDAVNLASRLKDAAKMDEILVSEPVFRASRYLFNYEALPPVSLKGIEEPVRIFKPLKIKDKPDPKRGIKGLYSPLVGRDKEFGLLKQAVEKLPKGKGGAIFIFGEAGLGKSRLLEELKKLITNYQLPITVLEGQCLSYGETLIYWPFLEILKNIFGIADKDSVKIISEKLLKKSKEVFPEDWPEIVPYIAHLFSINFTNELNEKVKYLEAQALKIQIFLSIRKLLATLAKKQPILLVIEDCHWIDSTSQELLDFIFDAFNLSSPSLEKEESKGNLLFIGLSRIDKEKRFWKAKERIKKRLGEDFLEITLNPLDYNASTQLTYHLLKIPGIPEEFKDKIFSKAEGNPFYLEEILHSMIDLGILIFEGGVWKLSTPDSQFSTISIPDTVQAVIASRLDRLESDIRDVLQTASVIGRSFYERILEYLSGVDALMLSLYLTALEEFEYIQKSEISPASLREAEQANLKSEIEYMFRHPLLQEVAYNGLLKKKRRELHQKTAQIIEEIYRDRLDEFTDILARQYANSDNPDKAIEWLKRAGEKAKGRYATDEAIKYFQKLISIIKEEKIVEADLVSVQLCQAYEALGDIYSLKSEYDEAIKNYREMSSAAEDKIIQSRSKRKIAGIYRNQGKFNDSLKYLEEAVEAIYELSLQDAILEKSEIHIAKGWTYWVKGEIEKAWEESETGLNIIGAICELPSEKKIKTIKSRAFNNLGVISRNKGEYDKAIEFYQKFLEISEETGNKQGIGIASGNLGNVYLDKGECDKAIELYQKYLEMSEEIGDKQGIGMASGNLGVVYYNKGENNKAIELFQKSLKISKEINYKRGIWTASNNLGKVYFRKSEYDEAIEFYQGSLEISKEIGDKQGMGITNGNLGGVYLEIGELKRAKRYLLKSEKMLKEIGDKKTLIEVYLNLAELQIKTENRGQKADGRWQETEDRIKKAVGYAEQALKLAEEIDSESGKAGGYFAFGKILRNLTGEELETSQLKETVHRLIQLCDDVDSSLSAYKHINISACFFRKAMEIYSRLGQKRSLADVYFEYGKLLGDLVGQALLPVENTAERYFNKALEIYKELKLVHKVKEIEKIYSCKSVAEKNKPMKCPKCNFENPEGQKFCGECGTAIMYTQSEAELEARLKAMQAFIPESLAEKIRKSKGQIEGERRFVTVIFADVSGFTAMSEVLDPEEVTTIMNECFKGLVEIVYKFEGTIDKFIGDCIMALWGAPVSHEDDPERAVRAALEMMEIIKRFNQEKNIEEPGLMLHIGINTGWVIAGTVGADLRMDYTVMGDTVNLASRLEGAAKRGQIFISQKTAELSKGTFDLKEVAPLKLKGKRKPVVAYEVLRLARRPRPSRGIMVRSEMVGREKEFALLKERLNKVKEYKTGRVVFITGEAGIGKTRLSEEFGNYALQEGFLWVPGRCLSYGKTISYWVFLEMLRSVFGIWELDKPEAMRERVKERLKKLFPDKFEEVYPYILTLLSLEVEEEYQIKVKYLDAKSLRLAIFCAVRDLFVALSQLRPVIFAFEDWHWADISSVELFEFLLNFVDKSQILLLAVMRPEKDSPGWNALETAKKQMGNLAEEIALRPLEKDDTDQLVNNLITGIPEQLQTIILTKSEGNPFFVEEIIRSLIDSDILIFKDEAWHLSPLKRGDGGVSALEIPDRIELLISSRIDRLADDAKQVLQAASVIGFSFYQKVLEYITQLEKELDTHLNNLEQREFILKKLSTDYCLLSTELEYIFKHPLIQEVAYNGLLKKRRKEFHRKVGECIEELSKDRLEEFYGMLAHHYFLAEEWEKAKKYLDKAAENALKHFDNDVAVNFYKKLKSIYEDEGEKNNVGVVCSKLGRIFNRHIGNSNEASQNLDQAIKLCNEDTPEIIDAYKEMSAICRDKEDYASAIKCLHKAYRLAKKYELWEKLLDVYQRLSQDVYYNMLAKDYNRHRRDLYIARGLYWRRKAVELEQKIGNFYRLAREYAEIMQFYLLIYDMKNAKIYLQKTFDTLKKYKLEWDPEYKGWFNRMLGEYYDKIEDFDKAEHHWIETLKIFEEMNLWRGKVIALNNLQYFYGSIREDWNKWIEMLKKYIEIVFDEKRIRVRNFWLAEAYIHKGEYDNAEKYLKIVLGYSNANNYEEDLPIIYAKLGVVMYKKSSKQEALEYLLKAERYLQNIAKKDKLKRVYNSLSESFLELQEYEKAMEYANKLLQMTDKIDKLDQCEVKYLIARIQVAQKKFNDANNTFATFVPILENLKEGREILIKVYADYGKLLIEQRIDIEKGTRYLQEAIDWYRKARNTVKVDNLSKLLNLKESKIERG